MNRRNFLKRSIAAVYLAALVNPFSALGSSRKYGRITACGPHMRTHHVRCWLDGEEVTNIATVGDDREGWVVLLKTESLSPLKIAWPVRRENRFGDVRFQLIPWGH